MTTTQQFNAWDSIRASRIAALGQHRNEFGRLIGYWNAKLNAPSQATRIVTRRSAKHKATATGQVGLKVFGTVRADCPVERVFVKRD